ncbi:50S ribosomal protein L17 [Candidatus Oleimmundimicrobium sp.]|uniref:50S ribosomal protein L17 n=1 Tax=Candidatus Oleimmundimicrobium sp. TaxID=3060597 RepID=UPI002726CA04|nr:50S ribosomal protein L17 [Candidatus Oleimmundimicrobium sp.]MDO8886034.1 50S ribosomal protein L17 [Candidatus Oleimmundimicrobium sp.]
MRHRNKGRKLATDASHQKALMVGLTKEIINHERIKTTEARAKEVRTMLDKVITLSKKGDLHSRRQVLATLNDRGLTDKLFTEIAPRFAERNGGYSRILKLGPRQGDAASMVIIELV